jgi:phosphoglycolate phosphatase-like HAD superfamily hydrolase
MLRVQDDSTLPTRFQQARCVFFDCDGVLFDSNRFKVDGMRHALAGEPEPDIERMVQFWRRNGGVSRWEKFRHYFEQIAPVADVDAAVDRACERFGDYSLAAYEQHEPVPEALEVVRALGAERAVVVSGASQVELATVFTRKGIASLFSEILGSPTKKLDLVWRVLSDRKLGPHEVLFIGDGAGDFRVARELAVHFVYLNQFSEWSGATDALRDAPQVAWADDWAKLLVAFGLAR